MSKKAQAKQRKKRRKKRTRKKIKSSSDRLRLTVDRSLNHMFAQIIDDGKGETIVSTHTKTDAEGDAGDFDGKKADAFLIGKKIAEKAQDEGIEKVVFDRSGYKYHGRVKALAEGAREGGLEF